MKILHVITTLDVGGAEMHLLAQVRGQAARGHAVSIAYLKGQGTLAEDFRRAGAVRVEALPGTLGAPFALWKRMRAADLVHSHLLKADMLAALVAACSLRGARLVASKHNDEQVLRHALVGAVHAILGNVPRRTIVLSNHVGDFVARYGHVRRSKLVRIYYGIDPTPFRWTPAAAAATRTQVRSEFGFGPRDVVFVCIARFAPQKAHAVLLAAFARARDAWIAQHATIHGRLRLLLVGDDPFGDGRVRAEAIARDLELGDDCVFAGIRRDVPHLLAASDVFVMCSLWEGLGLVFLEAMASAMPCLATRVSAVPEVVVDGVTGCLVPPADPVALGTAMIELAADPAARTRLGLAGNERVGKEFGLERMVDETLAVYRTVLGPGFKVE